MFMYKQHIPVGETGTQQKLEGRWEEREGERKIQKLSEAHKIWMGLMPEKKGRGEREEGDNW